MIEEYKCGCCIEIRTKRDAMGYCAIHGDDTRRIIPSGSHPCEGGCGKPVSAKRGKCLDCLEKEVAFRLKVGGIEASGAEIRRELYTQIGR